MLELKKNGESLDPPLFVNEFGYLDLPDNKGRVGGCMPGILTDEYTLIVYEFPEPEPVDPHTLLPALAPYQFKAFLEITGLTEIANAAIETITDPIAKIVARSRFENSQSYIFTDPLFQELLPSTGLQEPEITDLWNYGASL